MREVKKLEKTFLESLWTNNWFNRIEKTFQNLRLENRRTDKNIEKLCLKKDISSFTLLLIRFIFLSTLSHFCATYFNIFPSLFFLQCNFLLWAKSTCFDLVAVWPRRWCRMYVNIYVKNYRQFSLLFPVSFIGQLVYRAGGEGIGKRGVRYFSPLLVVDSIY